MTIYLLIPIIIIIVGIGANSIKTSNSRKMMFLCVALFIPFFVAGYRSVDIGTDTLNYVNFFIKASYSRLKDMYAYRYREEFEIGFALLCFIIGRFTKDVHIFLLVISFLTNVLMGIAIFRNSKRVFMPALLYILVGSFVHNMTALRQGLALAIVLNAFFYYKKQEYIKYSVIILVASLIHSFSIVFLGMIFLPRLITNRKRLILISVMVGSGLLFTLDLVHIVVLKWLPHYDYYFRHNWNSGQRFGVRSLVMVLVDMIVVLVLISRIDKTPTKGFTILEDRRRIMVFYTVVLVAGATSLIMMPRFGIYERCFRFFNAFLIFAIPEVMEYIKIPTNRFIIGSAVIAGGLVYYIYTLAVDPYNIVPFMLYT